MKTRDYQIDNIKGFLIILVVFGHMFLASSSENNWLTTLIYSFHMPVFIFLNGLFSKNITVKKVLYFGTLYLLIQVVYILVVKVTNYPWIPEYDIIITPIFHVWYLLSLTFWYFLSLILRRFSLHPIVVLTVSFICAFFVRFINFDVDGNYFAYARTIVFAPFFLVGYFISFKKIMSFRKKLQDFRLILLILLILLIFLITLNIFYFGNNANEWMRLFFGYVNYFHFADTRAVFIMKEIIQYFIGAGAVLILLAFVPSNRGILNYIGQHTLAIFICHPIIYFIVYNYLERANPTTLKPIIISAILTILAIAWSLVVEQIVLIVKHKFLKKHIKSL